MGAAPPRPAELPHPFAGLLDDAAAGAAPAVEYRVAGRGLRVHYADAELRAALAPALEHLRGWADDPEALDLFVRVGAPVPAAARPAGTIRPRLHFADGSTRGVMYPASGICGVLDVERRRAVWQLPDARRVPAAERGGPFRTILQWWLAGHDLQIAHAGAVGTGRAAALLVGRGGSGKSVTSVACAVEGLRFLGDDSVLCATGPAPAAHCLYGWATLHPEDAARFPSLRASATGDDKVLLDLTGRVAASLPLEAVLVPRVTGRPRTQARPLSGGETARAMAPSSLFNIPGSGERALARLVELARRVPGYALELGTDLRQVRDAVAELLEPPGRP